MHGPNNLPIDMNFSPELPDVELVLAACLDEVLVAADPSGLHSLGGKLLQFVRNLNAIMNKYIPKNFDKFFQPNN